MIVFHGLSADQQKWILTNYPKLKIKIHQGELSLNHLPPKSTRVLSVHTKCYLDNQIFNHLPNLELIVTRTTGTDHINLAQCKTKDIRVVNAAGQNAISVAEYTIGLILAANRNIVTAANQVKPGNFSDINLFGNELSGKTIGVVGSGAIGAHVLEIGKSFGMDLLAHDFRKNLTLSRKLGFRYVGIKELFRKADIISLHIPGTPLTRKLINRSLLQLIKPGTGLVNTARGSVVDTQAVLTALDGNKLAWYSTDVLDDEAGFAASSTRGLSPTQRKLRAINQKLVKHPKTVVTPHIAHATFESRDRILVQSIEMINQFTSGKKIKTII